MDISLEELEHFCEEVVPRMSKDLVEGSNEHLLVDKLSQCWGVNKYYMDQLSSILELLNVDINKIGDDEEYTDVVESFILSLNKEMGYLYARLKRLEEFEIDVSSKNENENVDLAKEVLLLRCEKDDFDIKFSELSSKYNNAIMMLESIGISESEVAVSDCIDYYTIPLNMLSYDSDVFNLKGYLKIKYLEEDNYL